MTVSTHNYLYFAYGSNMLSQQMEQRFVDGPRILKERGQWSSESVTLEKITYLGKGVLQNYERDFSKKNTNSKLSDFEGYANITSKINSQVEGVVYQLGEQHLQVLDLYEGVTTGHYTREIVTVEVGATQKMETAVVYIAHPSKVDDQCKPSKVYLDKLIAGAREFKLHPQTIQKLEQWPTV